MENQTLREDLEHSRQQVRDAEIQVKEIEIAKRGELERIQNELNLEISDLKDAIENFKKGQGTNEAKLQAQNQNLVQKLRQYEKDNNSLMQELQDQQEKYMKELSTKTIEALKVHDANLNIQIEMNQ